MISDYFAMSKELKHWLTNQMEVLMGFSDPTLVGHILTLEDEIATRNYCRDIFGNQDKFIDELVRRRGFKGQLINLKENTRETSSCRCFVICIYLPI